MHMRASNASARQRGFSLVEVMVSVVIIAPACWRCQDAGTRAGQHQYCQQAILGGD